MVWIYILLNILNICINTQINSNIYVLDNHLYKQTNIKLHSQKISDNIYFNPSFYLPSDLISLLPENYSFELTLVQGSYSDSRNSFFIPVDTIYRKDGYLNIFDHPKGYYYISNTFNPIKNYELFKKYFDVFSHVFQITLIQLYDRAKYIYMNNNTYFLAEYNDKPCSEHLDAIKEILPKHQWETFLNNVDYSSFFKSDHKAIRYSVYSNKEGVNFNIEITYRKLLNKLPKKYTQLPILKYNKFLLSKRSLLGVHFNFDNFIFNHNIYISNDFYINNKIFEIIEFIPNSYLNVQFSTMKILFYLNNTIQKELDCYQLRKYFDMEIYDRLEHQYPEVAYTYESKPMLQIKLKYKGNIDIQYDKINIKFELEKKVLNFESLDNDEEFGLLFPSGLIIVDKYFTETNMIYFNMPNVDNTMPFNIINLCWVIYGFLFVQIISLFLGKIKNKGFLSRLKERLISKYGFLFGK